MLQYVPIFTFILKEDDLFGWYTVSYITLMQKTWNICPSCSARTVKPAELPFHLYHRKSVTCYFSSTWPNTTCWIPSAFVLAICCALVTFSNPLGIEVMQHKINMYGNFLYWILNNILHIIWVYKFVVVVMCV